MDLTVIIVNYNVRYFLEQCLISVRKASRFIQCETYVVDNNSVDGSCSMISQQFPEVRLIRNLSNVGFSVANNQALKLAGGKFVLLLNPDTIVEEDTFTKCISFMNNHQDAGAIGVKMIDGKGRLLPESKRALPTPGTAFFKISGLAWLFPKSRLFNRYYLAHLDNSKTSEAEVISGAFMFIRKEALDKTGFLDEKFFMYGEDIDLSYRLIKAGYINYYYPEVKIIHYKGQSTKKNVSGYIVNFYKAMLIFTKKHFEKKDLKILLIIIQLSIYMAGFFTLCKTFLKKLLLPVTDAGLIYSLYYILIPVWGKYKFGEAHRYPENVVNISVLVYTIILVLSVFLAGGYKIPSRIVKTIGGIVSGTLVIYVIYALLPQEFRFSRAVVGLGGLLALIMIPLYRLFLAILGLRIVENPLAEVIRTLVVGDETGLINIKKLITTSGFNNIVIGRVSIKPDDLGSEVLGNIEQIKEVIRINRINEVIFSTGELSASQIINSMLLLSNNNVSLKIASTGEKCIIGDKTEGRQDRILSIDHSSFSKSLLIRRKGLLK
jgi:GT2 family glycosyltransferase